MLPELYLPRPTFAVDLETVNLPIPTALGIRETKIKSFSRISAAIIVSTALDIRYGHFAPRHSNRRAFHPRIPFAFAIEAPINFVA
jgi:hypothetical protein